MALNNNLDRFISDTLQILNAKTITPTKLNDSLVTAFDVFMTGFVRRSSNQAIAKILMKNAIVTGKDTDGTILSSPEFSENDMQSASELADACNLFYNRGRAVGWLFMILETVKINPSQFFRQFSEWTKNSNRMLSELKKSAGVTHAHIFFEDEEL